MLAPGAAGAVEGLPGNLPAAVGRFEGPGGSEINHFRAAAAPTNALTSRSVVVIGMSSRVLMPNPYGLGAVARAGLACGQAGTGACQGSAPRGALVFSRDGMRVVVPWARLPRRDPVAVLAGTRVAGCDAGRVR